MGGFVYKRTHKRKNGRASVLYYAVVERAAGDGTRHKDWGKGYNTRREADAALRQRAGSIADQTFVSTSRLTLGEYLKDQWLPPMRDRVKPTTHFSYERMLVLYVIPRLGGTRLQDLTPSHLNRLYVELRASGGTWQGKAKRSEPKPLSQKTVRNVHVVLSKALSDAIDSGLVVTNVASRAKPPRTTAVSRKIEAWTAEELFAFLDFVREDRLFACWHLAAHTGMRRGELLGLRWTDIDFDLSALAVRQSIVLANTTMIVETPKSGQARVINLERETIQVLREHRRRQRGERAVFGSDYEDSGLVFRREDGAAINPDRVSQLFDKLVRHSEIQRIKFHGLRHTHATLMLKANVPVKVVSERLGHSDPAFTLRIYQHVLTGMQAEAAATFGRVIRSAGQQMPEPLPPMTTLLQSGGDHP